MEKQFDLLLSNGHQDSMDLDTAAGRFDSILRDNDSAKKGWIVYQLIKKIFNSSWFFNSKRDKESFFIFKENIKRYRRYVRTGARDIYSSCSRNFLIIFQLTHIYRDA